MICTSPWNHLARMSVAAFLVTLATSAQAQEQKFKAVSVKTPDGLTISAQDWGNPNGPEILFIHGFSQSHLSWIKQVTSSDLAKEFHMVTYDLRGHGNSDKPFEPERYKTSKYWGDEVQAVMDATGLKRPVLVGWSYGGRVMADYLTTHGTAKLAGLNYVDAGQKADPSFFGPNLRNLPLMASENLAINIAATRAFLHDCFSIQPTQEEYETTPSLPRSCAAPSRVAFLLYIRNSEGRLGGGVVSLFVRSFRQHFLMRPFAWRDRVFRVDTDIWPAACVDTDPTSRAQRLAFAGKQKTRVIHDAL